MAKVAVIGAGSWGTALAKVLHTNGNQVTVWSIVEAEIAMLRERHEHVDKLPGVKLPEGYEAHVVPRSSTFKNYGIIQTNSCGIIDGTYCGDDDMWRMPVYAVRDTVIHVNDRICQFRIFENQPKITFDEVESLGNKNRGGFGSTGKQ